jgi:hypothetical protein
MNISKTFFMVVNGTNEVMKILLKAGPSPFESIWTWVKPDGSVIPEFAPGIEAESPQRSEDLQRIARYPKGRRPTLVEKVVKVVVVEMVKPAKTFTTSTTITTSATNHYL